MALREYLAGFEPKQPQIVGNMAVIPLINSQVQFEGIAGVENVKLKQDCNYDCLEFITLEDKLTVVPNGFTLITKEPAQDRTVPITHVLNKFKKVSAYCVQSSQGGLMNPKNNHLQTRRLLPLRIRQYAYQIHQKNSDIGALWGQLGKMNKQTGVKGDYLVRFFDNFKQQLEEFIAQFEPVYKQRGAITIINGRVVGIDIMPSYQSFLKIWELLIRDCYGAEAIIQQGDFNPISITSLQDVKDINHLLEAVKQMAGAEKNWAYRIVKAVLDQEVFLETSENLRTKTVGKLRLKNILTDELEGQGIINQNDEMIYLSLFRHTVKQKKIKAFPI